VVGISEPGICCYKQMKIMSVVDQLLLKISFFRYIIGVTAHITGEIVAMKKEITIAEFAKELKVRLNNGKTVDCCKEELLTLADIITDKIGSEKISVTWKD